MTAPGNPGGHLVSELYAVGGEQLRPSGPYSMIPKVSMVENTSFRHDTYFRLFHSRWIATK